MGNTPDHISVTQLRMWNRCPRQWEYRYIEGLKLPPAGAMVLGSAYHKGLEANFAQKVDTHEDMPVDDVLDAYANAFAAAAAGEVDWEDDDPGKLKDAGAWLVNCYQANVAPRIQPAAVEMRLDMRLGETQLVGIVDLMTDTGMVVDHKTTSRARPQSDVDADIQLTAYGLLLGGGDLCAQMHIAVRRKEPGIDIMQTRREMRDYRWFGRMAAQVAQLMQTGIAPPSPEGWHCGPKFCGYWQLCQGAA